MSEAPWLQALTGWTLWWPALVAGLLVLATHVPLGARVLDKGIVFIDLAIAQMAGLGVMVASLAGWGEQPWAVQASAAGAALAGAALLTATERRWPDLQEPLIGTLFVVTSCLGIVLLAGNPHGGEHLKDLLVGQILWVTPDQLVNVGLLSALIAALWWGLGPRRLGQMGFYALFALAVTASVQLVGVYLVFSSLIMPALATRQVTCPRRRTVLSMGAGALAYALGLMVSTWADLPTGAVIVLCMAGVCMAVAALVGSGRPARPPEPGENDRPGPG